MIDLVVIGAGPSGLAAAYEGVSRGAKVTVLERLPASAVLHVPSSFGAAVSISVRTAFSRRIRKSLELFTGCLGTLLFA